MRKIKAIFEIEENDPNAGSGSTLRAAMQTGRRAYGFEIKKDFYKLAKDKVMKCYQPRLF